MLQYDQLASSLIDEQQPILTAVSQVGKSLSNRCLSDYSSPCDIDKRNSTGATIGNKEAPALIGDNERHRLPKPNLRILAAARLTTPPGRKDCDEDEFHRH
ncbi:MAG TPA: hypothetical protein VH592_08715 [Gemmataceae bacterium]|jgi:hypothetical protein